MKRSTLVWISGLVVTCAAGILIIAALGSNFPSPSHSQLTRDKADDSIDSSASEAFGVEAPRPPADSGRKRPPSGRNGNGYGDPYRERATLDSAIDQMVASGQMDEVDAAAVLLNWADPCSRAVGFSERAARGRNSFGLSATFAERIEAFCRQTHDDFRDDWPAYKEALVEAASARYNPYMEQAERESVSRAMAAALETVSRSVNEAQVLNALTTIVTHTELESPFPGVDNDSVRPLFQGRLLYHDLPLAIICENLGGCGADHPLVARHCLALEMHDGCYQPRDIYHALEQTQTPIQQSLFWALKDQIRTMVISPDDP